MNIALITGRSPQLAQKEIEAVATILPFPWSLSIVQGNIVMLKPTSTDKSLIYREKSLWSQENKKLLVSLRVLQNRLGGTLKR